MPTYTFLCQKCSSHFTAMKSIAERDDTLTLKCPKCGAIGESKRVWPQGHSIGIQFVGEGWFRDGYSKNSSSEKVKQYNETRVSSSDAAPPAPKNLD